MKPLASRLTFQLGPIRRLASMPTILAALTYKVMQVSISNIEFDGLAFSAVFLVSGVVAYICIDVFLRIVNIIGMIPFVIYRLLLGMLLLMFI